MHQVFVGLVCRYAVHAAAKVSEVDRDDPDAK
jgi:hypothetical protein